MGDADYTGGSPPLHFRGLKNREGTVDSLRAYFGFGAATDLVVGGGSAGGLAAFLHVDWYAAQAPGAKARAVIDSGFFMDGDYNRDGKFNPSSYELRMANLYDFMNAKAGIAPTCVAAIGYKCLFAYHLLPFIKTPVLSLMSQFDATMGPGEVRFAGHPAPALHRAVRP